jgi:hypothetical protein
MHEALEGWLVPRKHAPEEGELVAGATVFIIPRASHVDEAAEEVEDLLAWNVSDRGLRGKLATRVRRRG